MEKKPSEFRHPQCLSCHIKDQHFILYQDFPSRTPTLANCFYYARNPESYHTTYSKTSAPESTEEKDPTVTIPLESGLKDPTKIIPLLSKICSVDQSFTVPSGLWKLHQTQELIHCTILIGPGSSSEESKHILI